MHSSKTDYTEVMLVINRTDIDSTMGLSNTLEILDKMLDGIKTSLYCFVAWRDFIKFLENKKEKKIIEHCRDIFLKRLLFFRKLLPSNKAIYIKRKRNK